MTDAADLLAAILANPADDSLRLVYADRLDDASDNPPCPRAEFIRVQVERHGIICSVKARGEGVWPDDAAARVAHLERRERELWTGGALFGILDEVRPTLPPKFVVHLEADRPPYTPRRPEAYVSRGFVGSLSCPAPDVAWHFEAIRSVAPVTRVVVTSAPVRGTYQCRGGWRVELATLEEFLAFASAEWRGVEFRTPPAGDEAFRLYLQELNQGISTFFGLPPIVQYD